MYRHLNVRVDYTDCDYSDLRMDTQDKECLTRLAARVREIAERPEMEERKRLWSRHNRLDNERPMVFADPENGWHEIIPEESLVCRNDIARHWELTLRKQIFWGDEMNDDYVVEPVFDLPHVYTETPWRIRGKEEKSLAFTTQLDGGAYHIESIMDSYDEIDNLLDPEIVVDYGTTEKLLELAEEIMGAFLKIQNRTVWFWSFGMTDEFAQLRGMDKMMLDFFDQPDGIHALMKRLQQGTLKKLDFLEQGGLLYPNNNYTFIGSGGLGYTDELPSLEPAKLSTMWGLAESQITVGISPDMFAEFIFPYQKEIMERFGLTCYGCCEGMDPRFHIVKAAKNLRRVSVSPWADPEKMSELLRKEYIYSMKPSPTPLAQPEIDMETAEKELKRKLEISRDNNVVEIIMKDNHTLGGNPSNITGWVNMAKRLVG
ncbi:hypothetical protein [Sediminispirochaeta smaragdinae]|uniref:Uroporphyrinogen decarboxylase (URO-D) domain-containing protein n=1 Tax=Sediminispirochaeta smaragdinae (strain DSM 11293 / JCM 15392 / SEBR 4228) TaxID=573413 RepID=E1R0Z3_SEDSS|nr:hypothetical protein [Sediminispirochaeta smaragdinae]ADK80242.1 hypothetical protein Spirs_1111 [Sediminispirochaeta smaragdinae DSM 11293]